MAEFALAMFGMVVFIAVLIKTWAWMSNMIIGRQGSFQDTRLAAGMEESAGMFVPYERPMLALIGGGDTIGGAPGGGGVDAPPPICAAGEAFYEAAQVLYAEGQALFDQADALTNALEPGHTSIPPPEGGWNNLGQQLEAIRDRIEGIDARIDWIDQRIIDIDILLEDPNLDPLVRADLVQERADLVQERADLLDERATLVTEFDALTAIAEDAGAEVERLRAEGQAKFNEAQDLMELAWEACGFDLDLPDLP